MLYDYECSKCLWMQEEVHGMLERPVVVCKKCGNECFKLIGAGKYIGGMNGGRGVYDFVDYNTTGRPVKINTKRQWQQHLKAHGLNDDIPNDPKNLKITPGNKLVDKDKQKRETKEAIVAAVKDKKFRAEVKQKVQKQLYEARNK